MNMPTCPTCVYAKGICDKTGGAIRFTTGCTYHTPKPVTNADLIRGMTLEELAEWIAGYVLNLTGGSLKMSTQAWVEWLKQEASDE